MPKLFYWGTIFFRPANVFGNNVVYKHKDFAICLLIVEKGEIVKIFSENSVLEQFQSFNAEVGPKYIGEERGCTGVKH